MKADLLVKDDRSPLTNSYVTGFGPKGTSLGTIPYISDARDGGAPLGLRTVVVPILVPWEFDLIRQAPSLTQNRPASDVTFGPTTPKRATLRLRRFAQVKTVPPS